MYLCMAEMRINAWHAMKICASPASHVAGEKMTYLRSMP